MHLRPSAYEADELLLLHPDEDTRLAPACASVADHSPCRRWVSATRISPTVTWTGWDPPG